MPKTATPIFTTGHDETLPDHLNRMELALATALHDLHEVTLRVRHYEMEYVRALAQAGRFDMLRPRRMPRL